jgi:hypothetical protein
MSPPFKDLGKNPQMDLYGYYNRKNKSANLSRGEHF